MATAPNPLPPPPPMFDKNGAMTPAWQWFFYQIFTSASAIAGIQVLEAFDAASDSGDQASADAQALAAMGDATTSSAAAIEETKRALAALAETPAKDCSDLQKLVWALGGSTERITILTGVHTLRTATPAADNTAFFETDTQVLYVASAGAWVAVAGSNAPVAHHAEQTAGLALTAAYQDIPGCSVTLDVAGTWLITGTFDVDFFPADQFVFGHLLLNGAAVANIVSVSTTATELRGPFTQCWLVTASAGYVAKLQAEIQHAGAGGSNIAQNSQITAVWLHA